MSHLLHRRRGHDSEDEDEEESIVSTTDDNYTTSDEDDSQEEETDSEYDSSEQETETGSESEGEEEDEALEQQPTTAVVETSTQEIQQTNATSNSSSSSSHHQTKNIKEQVNHQPTTKPSSPSPVAPTTTVPATTAVNTTQTVDDMEYQDLQQQQQQQQQQQEKTIQELREYRRKLAEDPSFVPYVGLFWGHDDRYRQDSLVTNSEAMTTTTTTRESLPRFSQNTTPTHKKPSYDRNLDPLMHKKWDHSGYEELLRLEEQEERQKREWIESGQSAPPNEQQQHHRLPAAAPRLPRYHQYNNHHARGRGGGGGGGYNRGGQHYSHSKYGSSQKRPLNQQQQQQQEEWPPLAGTSVEGGNTAGQSISDNKTTQQDKVDSWSGSVDNQKDINVDGAFDNWKTPATTVNAAEDGWGSAPETQVVDTAAQTTPKQDSRTVDQAEHGWGALPESKPTLIESKQLESSTTVDNAPLSPPPATTTCATTDTNDTSGWGEQPTMTTTSNDGWNTVTESKDVSGWVTTEPAPPVKTTKTTDQDALNQKGVERFADIPATRSVETTTTTTTDGWGKPEETLAQDTTWSNDSKTQDWQTTPQWDHNNSSSKEKAKSSLTTPLQEIPAEEKASSSWANVKLDVQVHTTPSDFSKIDYSHMRRYDAAPRRDHSSSLQEQATLDESSKQSSDQWGADASTTAPHAEWHTTTEETAHAQSEWTSTTPPKSREATQVNAGWNTHPTTSSWNAAAPEGTSSAYDQSQSSSSSSVRHGGWQHNNNNRSSNSANWNADREWNNKMRRESSQQQKKSRAYFSTKTTADIVDTASNNSTDGFHTPETSAWGHFHSTGDDDSDVEIILEAEEEPEWSKQDNQVLGMTAPAESLHRMTKSNYLQQQQQQQHDSGQSSPLPEYNQRPANGRHGNKHRTYEDQWHPPTEQQADAYHRPMYYPTPSYMPMIPNGNTNGTPMYAMPYPMGTSNHDESASSPLHEPSSSTSPLKYYTPSPPPNVMQHQQQQQLPPGYEANGMVYYGMDPSTMYPPPQAFYYYAPPPPPPQGQSPQHLEGYDVGMRRPSSLSPPRLHLQQAEEDGWGPTPETVETEEQWRTTTTTKSQHHHDFQNRKQQQQQQQQQPVNQYYYSQPSHHY